MFYHELMWQEVSTWRRMYMPCGGVDETKLYGR